MALQELFAPYRAQLTDCYCALCTELVHSRNTPLTGTDSWSAMQDLAYALNNLLTAVQGGTHHRVELVAYTVQRKAEAVSRGLYGKRVPQTTTRDFYRTGMGMGMTPGTYARLSGN